MNIVDESELPQGCVLIDLGGEQIFHYSFCIGQDIYIKGGIEYHTSLDGWYRFTNISSIHDKIGDTILNKDSINSAEFRFLRKEIGVTVSELSDYLHLDSSAVSQWECGEGFMPNHVDRIIATYKAYRQSGYLENLATIRNSIDSKLRSA